MLEPKIKVAQKKNTKQNLGNPSRGTKSDDLAKTPRQIIKEEKTFFSNKKTKVSRIDGNLTKQINMETTDVDTSRINLKTSNEKKVIGKNGTVDTTTTTKGRSYSGTGGFTSSSERSVIVENKRNGSSDTLTYGTEKNFNLKHDNVSFGLKDNLGSKTVDKYGEMSSSSRERTFTASASNSGVATNLSIKDSKGGNHHTWSGTKSATGAFSIILTKINENKYQVTTTIHLGLSVGGEFGGHSKDQEKAKSSIGVSAGVSGDVVYIRILSPEETKKYLEELKKIEKRNKIVNSTAKPEYSLLSRLATLRLKNLTSMASFFDSKSASLMSKGEGISFSGNAEVEGSAGINIKGVGVSGKKGTSRQYGIKIVRTAKGIEMTVTLGSKDTSSVTVEGGYETASIGAGSSNESGQLFSMTFVLNPEDQAFDNLYGEIKSTLTKEGLEKLARKHKNLLKSKTDTTSTKDRKNINESAGGVKFSIATENLLNESITENTKNLNSKHTGSESLEGAFDIFGFNASKYTHTQGLTSNVSANKNNEAELSMVLTDNEKHTNYLRELWGTQVERLIEYDVDTNDMKEFINRARNKAIWKRANFSWKTSSAWNRLRIELLNPHPKKEWINADKSKGKSFAKKIAQAHALAEFMSKNAQSNHGYESYKYVLREWGGGTGFNMKKSRAKDLGVLWEWPNSLKRTRSKFYSLKKQIFRLKDRYLTLQNIEKDRDLSKKILKGLVEVKVKIQYCHDFSELRAQLEMLLAIDRLIEKVSLKLENFDTQVETVKNQISLPIDMSSELTSKELLSEYNQQNENNLMSLPLGELNVNPITLQRIDSIESALEMEQGIYETLLNNAHNSTPSEYGGGYTGTWWFWKTSVEAKKNIEKAGKMHEEWITRIRELRSLYAAAGIPKEKWNVKPDRKSAPRSLDPDIKKLIEYHKHIFKFSPQYGLVNRVNLQIYRDDISY